MTTQPVVDGVPAGTYAVDPVHTSIGFAVVHNGVSTFRSRFTDYEAKLTGGESPSLQGTVEVASIDVSDAQLKGHLLSPDFFDAERYPQLRFTSSEVKVGEGGAATVRGELEVKGNKRQVEASGKLVPLGADLAGKPRVGISLTTTVDRRDFGLDWNAELPSGRKVLDDDVTIEVELELVAEES